MEGGTVGFIGIEGVGIIGMFCVSDKIRDEAKDVIRSLIEHGYEVTMLTGDSDGAAKAVGRAVGLPIEAIHSHLTPGRLSVILHDLPLPCRPVKMSMS